VSRTGIRDQNLEDLEVERDFLLRSLQDLNEEHLAGEVSDEDYERLHDSYTARAADVLRAIGASTPNSDPATDPDADPDTGGPAATGAATGRKDIDSVAEKVKKPITRNRVLLIGGVLSVLAGIAVAVVVSNTSSRLPGETATGAQPSLSTQQAEARELVQAETLEEEGQYSEALQLFQKVVSQDPGNAVALSEAGWLEFEAGVLGPSKTSLQQGQSTEERAVSVDPGLPASHAYLGTMFFLEKNPAQAVVQYGQFIADGPSAAELNPFIPDIRKAYSDEKKALPSLTTATSQPSS
jgi:tetratricopeptide (TPR) repeat protein